MTRIVILTEEPSMKEALDILLPPLLGNKEFLVLSHQGKSDLERSIPRKLRGWNETGAKFLILRDNDGGDCLSLKNHLLELIPERKKKNSLVRIVCQELEGWFLGDLAAVAAADLGASKNLKEQQNKAKFRNPDTLTNAKEELKKLAPQYKQMSGSRAIAKHMTVKANASNSFGQFVSGLQRLAE